jgi:hypothetical protein
MLIGENWGGRRVILNKDLMTIYRLYLKLYEWYPTKYKEERS